MSFPFDPTANFDPNHIQRSILRVEAGNTFSRHDKTSSSCVPRLLSKVIHWIFHPSERIARVRDAFISTYSNRLQHDDQNFSLNDQVTLYNNLNIFNRRVIQKHNDSILVKILFWTRVPLIDLKTMEETINERLSNNYLKKLADPAFKDLSIEAQAALLNECKTLFKILMASKHSYVLTESIDKVSSAFLQCETAFNKRAIAFLENIQKMQQVDEKDLSDLQALENTSTKITLPEEILSMLNPMIAEMKKQRSSYQEFLDQRSKGLDDTCVHQFKYVLPREKRILELNKSTRNVLEGLHACKGKDLASIRASLEANKAQYEMLKTNLEWATVINRHILPIISGLELLDKLTVVHALALQWQTIQHDFSTITKVKIEELKAATAAVCQKVPDTEIAKSTSQIAKDVFARFSQREQEYAQWRQEFRKAKEELESKINAFNPLVSIAPDVDMQRLDRFAEFDKTLPADAQLDELRVQAIQFREFCSQATVLFAAATKVQQIYKSNTSYSKKVDDLAALEAEFGDKAFHTTFKKWIALYKEELIKRARKEFTTECDKISTHARAIRNAKTAQIDISWDQAACKALLDKLTGAIPDHEMQNALKEYEFISKFCELYESYKEDFIAYKGTVDALCAMRDAAPDQAGKLDIPSPPHKPHPILELLDSSHPIANAYRHLDDKCKLVRQLSQDMLYLTCLTQVNIQQSLDQIKEILNRVYQVRHNALQEKDFAPNLYEKYQQTLTDVKKAWDPIKKEYDIYFEEQARLNKLLNAAQSKEEIRRYFSLKLFKQKNGISLHALIRKHNDHLWSTDAYKKQLQDLLAKIPPVILNEHELLTQCAQIWYGTAKVNVDLDKLKLLCQRSEIPPLLKMQLDLIPRLQRETHPYHLVENVEMQTLDSAKLKHEWLLCNALLRSPAGNNIYRMLKRIKESSPRYIQELCDTTSTFNIKEANEKLFKPMLAKIWSTNPTDEDLKSQSKMHLLLINEIVHQLVLQAYDGDLPDSNRWRIEQLLPNLLLLNNALLKIAPSMTKNSAGVLDCVGLIDRIMNDSAAFATNDNYTHSLRLMARLAYEAEVLILDWLDGEPDFATISLSIWTDNSIKEQMVPCSHILTRMDILYNDVFPKANSLENFSQQMEIIRQRQENILFQHLMTVEELFLMITNKAKVALEAFNEIMQPIYI